MNALRILFVGVGGFLGANARYLLGAWIHQRFDSAFPLATLLVNVTGSFAAGLFLYLATERFTTASEYRLFIAVGFLGAYTTFSAFTWESLELLRGREYLLAAGNLTLSLSLGMAAVVAGWLAGRLVW